MKAIMMSIQPKWADKIISGEKTIEVRKSFHDSNSEMKCFIYRTKSYGQDDLSGKVVGEFICRKKLMISVQNPGDTDLFESCLTRHELEEYGKGRDFLYGWDISNLKIYENPKDLSDYRKYYRKCYYEHLGNIAPDDCHKCNECNLKKAPQTWCYVDVDLK